MSIAPPFPYVAVSSGFLPFVTASVAHKGNVSESFPFLVDSGAQFSFAPRYVISEVFPGISGLQEIETPCVDVHGKAVFGIAVTVQVQINGLPSITEEIWFSGAVKKALLGQTFFEKVEVRFRNFHPERYFEMASPPNLVVPTLP